jgi:ATP-binding cassette, subfamily C (CFTR/MRP), member 1
MKFWTAAVTKHGHSVDTTYLAVFVTLGVITLLAVLGVCFHVFTRMAPTSASKLHSRLLETVVSAPLAFFTSTPTGETLNRFSQDMSLIDSELPSALIQVSGPLCLGIVQAVFICLSAAYFVTTLPAVLIVMYFLQKYYLRTSRQIRLLDIEAKAPLYSHFLETLQGLVTIRAFGWQDDFKEQNIALLDKSQKPFYLMFCVQRWLTLVLDLIVAALAVLLMVMVVKLRTQLDAGFVALALLNVMSFNNNLTAIIQMWTQLENSLGAIARLKIFDEHTKNENLPQEILPVPPSWPSEGAIQFHDFSARYSDDLPDVVKNIDLSIRPGSKVAFTGTSGSGKSSLVASLFRLLETTQGATTIDNVDISTLPREDVRSRVIALPQDPFFLKGTIRENIDPTNQASDLVIEGALRKVQLWDIVSSSDAASNACLERPLDPESLLSQGQQQLFCLARAIVRHCHSPSKIVVLDEPTASVDLETDELMQRVIRQEFAGCTIIAVAHRLRTIMDFDIVVVMERGEIGRTGKPEDVIRDGRLLPV